MGRSDVSERTHHPVGLSRAADYHRPNRLSSKVAMRVCQQGLDSQQSHVGSRGSKAFLYHCTARVNLHAYVLGRGHGGPEISGRKFACLFVGSWPIINGDLTAAHTLICVLYSSAVMPPFPTLD